MAKTKSTIRKPSFAEEISRPCILLLHGILLILVSTGTKTDRQWNLKVQKVISTPTAENLLNCTTEGITSSCCEPQRLQVLKSLYAHATSTLRNMEKFDLMLIVSSFASLMCMVGYIIELGIKQRVDSTTFGHRLINRIAILAYVFSLFLLSHGIVGMSPKSPSSPYCADHYPKTTDPEIRIRSYCYRNMGGCRDRDFLLVSLVCMILCPFVGLGLYLLAGAMGCFEDLEDDLPRQIPPSHDTVSRVELPNNLASVPSSVKNQCRQDFVHLLNTLYKNPSFRNSENFLRQLSLSFRNYIRSGHFPVLGSSTTRSGCGPDSNRLTNPQMSQMTVIHNGPFPAYGGNLLPAVHSLMKSSGSEEAPPKYEDVTKKNLGYETLV